VQHALIQVCALQRCYSLAALNTYCIHLHVCIDCRVYQAAVLVSLIAQAQIGCECPAPWRCIW
jgi:hypothetical protein